MSTVRAILALCVMAAVCDAKLRFLSSKPLGAARAQKLESMPAFRRSYSSGSATTSGSASGTASGTTASGSDATTPTPAPTPAPTAPTPAPTTAATEAGGKVITQVVRMSSPFTASTITTYGTSAYATAVNFGYGHSLGIVTTAASGTTYKTGCSVSSTASIATRRAAISIEFSATVSAALAAAAETASSGLTAASLNTAVATVITNLKQSDAATYGSLTVPNATQVQAPTTTTVASSASSNAMFSAVALLGATALALKQ